MTPSGIEPATFRFVAQHINHCGIAVPRTSVRNFQYSLRNNTEKRSFLLLRSGSSKSLFFVHTSCLKLQRFIVYRTGSMSVVLYRPLTLPLTLWEEHRLRVHQVSSYMFRYSMGVIISVYTFQCIYGWYYELIFTPCTVQAILK
jgi:hypothetical protein